MKIIFLHGFLGLPSDWQGWQRILFESGYQSEAVNLWDFLRGRQGGVSFYQLAEAFHDKYLNESSILFGYSMGGRIALEIARCYPEKIKGLLLFSTQVVSPVESVERQSWEERWSEKWLNQEWESVVTEWNSQDVFLGSKDIKRNESDFDRMSLVRALQNWSIRQQSWSNDNFPQMPVLWCIGEDDHRMLKSKNEIESFSAKVKIFMQKSAGHRFIFDDQLDLKKSEIFEQVIAFLRIVSVP